MANVVRHNYAIIDTFGADVQISRKWVKVLAISVIARSNNEGAVFKNKQGDMIFVVGSATDLSQHFVPSQPIRIEGLIYDDSSSTLEAGDMVIIHLA